MHNAEAVCLVRPAASPRLRELCNFRSTLPSVAHQAIARVIDRALHSDQMRCSPATAPPSASVSRGHELVVLGDPVGWQLAWVDGDLSDSAQEGTAAGRAADAHGRRRVGGDNGVVGQGVLVAEHAVAVELGVRSDS